MKTPRKDRTSTPGRTDKTHQDELLDEALKATFPASDPIAIDIEGLNEPSSTVGLNHP